MGTSHYVDRLRAELEAKAIEELSGHELHTRDWLRYGVPSEVPTQRDVDELRKMLVRSGGVAQLRRWIAAADKEHLPRASGRPPISKHDASDRELLWKADEAYRARLFIGRSGWSEPTSPMAALRAIAKDRWTPRMAASRDALVKRLLARLHADPQVARLRIAEVIREREPQVRKTG